MFKNYKEMRDLKKENLKYINFLLFSVCDVVVKFQKSLETAKESGISEEEAAKILSTLKDVDPKDMVSKIVDSIKAKEKVE